MKTFQVKIKETLCMTIEVDAENAQQAEVMVQEAYKNEEYVLDAEHFKGVEFIAQEKEIEDKFRAKKHDRYER